MELQESPLILLEKGILFFDKEQYSEAKYQFKKVIGIDESADFAIEAKNYLEEIIAIEAEEVLKNQNSSTMESEEK